MSPQGPVHVEVTRGDRFDVAEWTAGEGPSFGPAAPPPSSSSGSGSRATTAVAVLASVAIVVATVLLVRGPSRGGQGQPLVPTVADLQAVHAHVSAGGHDVRRLERLSVGEAVETDADGRGRLRLDDGTAFVLDRATRLTLTAAGITLERGRVFVQGAPGAHTELDLGGPLGILSGATVGAERSADGSGPTRLYVASGEITVRAAGAEQAVRSGDTATLTGDHLVVAPERGFDDWTGGLAAPWGASGSPRRAMGELWGRPSGAPAGDAGSPLTIRAHDVRATLTRELAETEVRTTFFNAGSDAVVGDFRMAVPAGAIVGRFAVARGEAVSEGHVSLAARKQSGTTTGSEVLEWAGEGWVRATVPAIAPGATVTVIVGYAEWLSPRPKGDGKSLLVEYRYPMVGGASPPLIGEFSARIDATPSAPASIAAGLKAQIEGHVVAVHLPDFRPTADLVVDLELAPWTAPARLYTAPATGEDDAGGTIVVRTETPVEARDDGVTLALVVDTSGSIEPALFDAERAMVEAVLGGLGARDRVAVIAADQTARPVGPATVSPVTAALRKAVSHGLSELKTGGASDLGRALEAGADALPEGAPAAMVIYLGDGWPTMGDPTVDLMLARLARRPGGAPRLGAVAVGPIVNRFALAALVRGSGPLLEVADTADAAQAAIALIAEALQPTVAGVEVVFGPEVERIYPRGPRAVVAGETVTAVGRVRGELPKEITLRWHDARGTHEERRALVAEKTVDEADVTRRWAAARVEEVALHGRGREAATDVALRAGLLTPWTGWLVGGNDGYVPTTLSTRILDLSSGSEAGFSAAFGTPRGSLGALANVPQQTDFLDGPEVAGEDAAFKGAVASAAGRVVDDAGAAVRSCRDTRAARSPELGGSLDIAFKLDGEGHATAARAHGAGGWDDPSLDRCVEVVVEGLLFPSSDLKLTIDVTRRVELPAPRGTLRSRRCSPTSTLLMPLRRGVWRERLDRSPPATVYLEAKQGCELPTWTDRRALLELVLLFNEDGRFRLGVARELEQAGEADAAALLRREAVRRAKSPEELRAMQQVLLGDERYPEGAFRKQYGRAVDDRGRLAVIRRFLGIAPHDARLRRRLLAVLEGLGMKQELAEEVRRFRRDPFADAGLLADGASALRRAGDEAEARRAFGELAERAPEDPWARAFLGDRLRNEGWFDDATLAYQVLEELVPDEPGAILRLALAHAGAGRLDLAERMLARVAQTGGRSGDAHLGDLASRLANVLLAEARSRPGVSADDADRLARASLELPYPAGATVFLLRTPAGSVPIEVKLLRGPKEAREEVSPDVASPGIGLYTLRLDPGDASDARVWLRRDKQLPPARATHVHLDALLPQGRGKPLRLVSTEADVPVDGKPIELKLP